MKTYLMIFLVIANITTGYVQTKMEKMVMELSIRAGNNWAEYNKEALEAKFAPMIEAEKKSSL